MRQPLFPAEVLSTWPTGLFVRKETDICPSCNLCGTGHQLLSGANQAAEHQLLLALPGHHQVAHWQASARPAGRLNRQAGRLHAVVKHAYNPFAHIVQLCYRQASRSHSVVKHAYNPFAPIVQLCCGCNLATLCTLASQSWFEQFCCLM